VDGTYQRLDRHDLEAGLLDALEHLGRERRHG
jgi:hypothetical protein